MRKLLFLTLFFACKSLSAQSVNSDSSQIALNKEINDPCSRIDYQYDNFHYIKKYNTAIDLPTKIADTSYYKNFDAIFYKYIYKNVPSYTLHLSTTSSLPSGYVKGVIIILTNGKRINKPLARVETNVETIHDEATYVISSFVTLTTKDIILLKGSPIKEYELYADQSILEHADIVYKMFLCLLNRK